MAEQKTRVQMRSGRTAKVTRRLADGLIKMGLARAVAEDLPASAEAEDLPQVQRKGRNYRRRDLTAEE